LIKRLLCLAFVFFFFGILVRYFSNYLLILCLYAGVGWYLHKVNYARPILLSVVLGGFFVCGLLRMEWHQHQWPELVNKKETVQTVTGKILRKEVIKEKTYYTIAQLDYQVLIISDTDRYPIRATVVAKGPLKQFQRPSNDGGYNEQLYYEGKNIAFALFDDHFDVLKQSKFPLAEGLYVFRKKIVKSLQRNLSQDNAGTLIAMITGEKQYLDEETKTNYQESGIAHLLAISGTHLSILILGVYRCLRKGKVSYGKASIISAVVLCCFSIMSGMSVSTLRAGAMVLLFLLSQYLGMNYDAYTGMAVAGFYLLMVNPNCILSMSAQFSFLAVFGAVTGGNLIKKKLNRLHPLAATFFISFTIMMFILPLSLLYSYQFSLYQVLLNTLILPTAGMLLGLGMMGGILGTVIGAMGKVLLLPCDFLLSLYEILSKWTLTLPKAIQITGCPALWKVVAYYIILTGILIVKEENKNKNGKYKFAVKMMFLLSACLLLFFGNGLRRSRITVLDVGQGDGIYMQDQHYHYMIDGGSASNLEVGKYTILPYLRYHGVRQIDAWFISHCDTDHVSGLIQLLEKNYPIKKIIFSQKVEKNENFKKIMEKAKANKVTICYWRKGSSMGTKELCIQCPFLIREAKQLDANERSMWLEIDGKNGFKGLLAGDSSIKVEKEYMEEKKPTQLSFLKVSHHGSKNSSSAEFLDFCKPQLAVISAGCNNSYGHPSKETLWRLEYEEIPWVLTMSGGQIDLFLDTSTYVQKKINEKYN